MTGKMMYSTQAVYEIVERLEVEVGEYVKRNRIPETFHVAIDTMGALHTLLNEDPKTHMGNTTLPDDCKGVEGWKGEVLANVETAFESLAWFEEETKKSGEIAAAVKKMAELSDPYKNAIRYLADTLHLAGDLGIGEILKKGGIDLSFLDEEERKAIEDYKALFAPVPTE
jgi:hypothetical protein